MDISSGIGSRIRFDCLLIESVISIFVLGLINFVINLKGNDYVNKDETVFVISLSDLLSREVKGVDTSV